MAAHPCPPAGGGSTARLTVLWLTAPVKCRVIPVAPKDVGDLNRVLYDAKNDDDLSLKRDGGQAGCEIVAGTAAIWQRRDQAAARTNSLNNAARCHRASADADDAPENVFKVG